MVVRDLRDPVAQRERVIERTPSAEQRHGRHPHGGPIPEASVWSGHRTCDPPAKRSSVASVGMASAPALEGGCGLAIVDDDVGDGGRAHSVVGIRAAPVEELEVLLAPSALRATPTDRHRPRP